ncbi:MAG: DUF3226 domain-containing protein [Thiotrichaceae bacterium]
MKSIAIICEGKTDMEFIRGVVKHLDFKQEQVDFYVMGSKSRFFDKTDKKYRELKLRVEADQIVKVLFMIDADNAEKDQVYGGFENTQRELMLIIKQLGFAEISQVFITCDPTTKTGYLESLILSTLCEKQRACIQRFLDCSEFKSKEDHKAIINQVYKTAYPEAPYNFEHQHFNELKQQLTELFQDVA